MKIVKHIGRFIRAILRIAVALCVLVAAAWMFVQTTPGRRVLAEQLSRRISSGDFSILIDDVRLPSVKHVVVGHIVLSDADGAWLEIQRAEGVWNPWSLRGGVVDLRDLRAEFVRMARVPHFTSEEAHAPARQRSAFEIDIDHIAAGRVAIDAPVSVITIGLEETSGSVGMKSDASGFFLRASLGAASAALDGHVLQHATAKAAVSYTSNSWKVSGVEVRCDSATVTGVATSGAASLTAEIAGGNGQGTLTARAAVESLAVRGVAAEAADADGEIRWASGEDHAAVKLDARVVGLAAGSWSVTSGAVHADGRMGDLAVRAEATGSVPAPLAAQVAGRVRWTGSSAGFELASATVDVSGVHAALSGPFSIARDGGRTLVTGGVALAGTGVLGGDFSGTFAASGETTNATIVADVSLAGARAGSCIASAATVRVEGVLPRPALSFASSGACRFPYALQGEGIAEWSEDRRGVEIVSASLDVAGIRAVIADPLHVFVEHESSSIHAMVRMDETDVSALPQLASLAGRARAALAVDGALAQPVVRGEMVVTGLAASRGDLGELPPLGGEVRFVYSNRLLAAHAFVATSAWGHARAQLEAPVALSLLPFEFQWLKTEPAALGVDAAFDLGVLNHLPSFHESRIGGAMEWHVSYKGTEAGGAARGECTLADGEYENFASGTVLRKVRARLVSSGDKLVVESATATDGGVGRFDLKGQMGIAPGSGLPFHFNVDFKRARIVRRPDADAEVSGALDLDGHLRALRVDGDVRVDSSQVRLDYVRRKPPVALGEESSRDVAAGRDAGVPILPWLTLRLGIDIPGSLDIRGRSLESVWGGHVDVGITDGVVRLGGYVEPRRGTFLFLKRSFKLADGRVEFDGGWPPEPTLRLTATYSRSDIAATLDVTGNLESPSIALRSDPPMPTDEILSRVLFGKDAASVSPLQAVELASAATSLRQGGGPDFMGQARNAVGVDRIELRDNGEAGGGTEVAAGKYLGERTYVEVKRTGGEQAGVGFSVEYELHPRVMLEADSGVDMRTGVGLYWKLDY